VKKNGFVGEQFKKFEEQNEQNQQHIDLFVSTPTQQSGKLK